MSIVLIEEGYSHFMTVLSGTGKTQDFDIKITHLEDRNSKIISEKIRMFLKRGKIITDNEFNSTSGKETKTQNKTTTREIQTCKDFLILIKRSSRKR